MPNGFVFNAPPNWPPPPEGWEPPPDWVPDPSFPPAPDGWVFWSPAPDPVVEAAPPPDPEPAPQPAPEPQPAPMPLAESEVPVEQRPPAAPLTEARVPVQPTEVPRIDPQTTSEQLPVAEAPPVAVLAQQPDEGGTVPEMEELRERLAAAEAELAAARAASAGDDLVELSDERVLQEVGIYRYHHPLENSEEYRERLRELEERIKDSIKSGEAILVSEMFTFDNSLAKGRRMSSDLGRLMLRAYNAEADNCVRSLRAGNVVTAKKRLEASVTSIARLGSMMEMRVSLEYHGLRIEELELTADFLMKVQEEKERAHEERERLREERKVAQELAVEREKLDKERAHLQNALDAVQAQGDGMAAQELREKLEAVDAAIAHNDFRATHIRAGYVYVISNEGAFGKDVVKIGLTRRLEPLDRVRELGGASVPFPFDVHALFFSEDAVSLETELHHIFADRRMNHVNGRREFFFAAPHEVRTVLDERVGNLLEFVEDVEATEFRQSRSMWPGSLQDAAGDDLADLGADDEVQGLEEGKPGLHP
jgi:hypothetical protein